jgi:hypothetical protein
MNQAILASESPPLSLGRIDGGRETLVDSGIRLARPRALSPPPNFSHQLPPFPRKAQTAAAHPAPLPPPLPPLHLRLSPPPFSAYIHNPRATTPSTAFPAFPFPLRCVLLQSFLSLHGSRVLTRGRGCAVSLK